MSNFLPFAAALQIMVAVRSTLRLEVPLVHASTVLVSPAYVETLVSLANEKMAENLARIARFLAACQKALAAVAAPSSLVAPPAMPAAAPPREPATVALCDTCGCEFPSRNKLFAHVAAAHRGGPACP